MKSFRCPLFWLPLGLSAFGTIVLAGCNKHQAAAPSAGKDADPAKVITVTTVKPVQKALRRVIEQPAHIEAIEETPLLARISGYIKKVHVDRGDRVKGPRFDDKDKQIEPGQTLAEIFVPDMEEELLQKKALVAQAKAEVQQVKAALKAAEAQVATAKALVLEAEAGRERAQANYDRWASEYGRMKKLGGGVLDEQTLSETERQVKSMAAAQKEIEARIHSVKAGVLESEAKRNKAKADVAAAKAKVQVARAEEARMAALVDFRFLRAPYDGVITSREVHTGHFLTGAGVKPLFTIARTDVVRVLVDVPEAEAVLIKDGVPVRVRCQTIKDHEFEGKVTRTSWTLDGKSRTLRVETHLPNKDDKLRPGSYAYVSFFVELSPTYTLPKSAVLTQGDQAGCYCVEEGKATRVPLKIGAADATAVGVLKKQVKGGEWQDVTGQEEVIVDHLGSLSEGQAVVLKKG